MTDESIALWQEKLQPILSLLREHVTIDQLEKLRDEAKRDMETPPPVLHVIQSLYRLRLEAERV